MTRHPTEHGKNKKNAGLQRFLSLLLILAIGALGVVGVKYWQSIGKPSPSESQAAEASLPAAAPTLKLPIDLDGNTASSAQSLEDIIESYQLPKAPLGTYRNKLQPLLGTKVVWKLNSWGGEVSSEGYHTPSEKQPPKVGEADVGRIRFVSTALGPKPNLGDVMDSGHPVIMCLALFSPTNGRTFARSDQALQAATGTGVHTIEAQIWGVTAEGGTVALWLHNCAKVTDIKHTDSKEKTLPLNL